MNIVTETPTGEFLPVQTDVPRCFVCGPDNPSGLKLRFRKEGETALSAEFTAPEDWTGWGRMLHGGFHGLLLDEIMSWVVWGLMGVKAFVTREMTVSYLRPVYVDCPLVIFGFLVEDGGRDIIVRGEIRDADGTVLSESRGVITRINPERMKSML
jgi:uncharacterized protein (TIGR00369 family)